MFDENAWQEQWNRQSVLVYAETGVPLHVDPKTAREFGLKPEDKISDEQTRRAVVNASVDRYVQAKLDAQRSAAAK